MDYFFPNSIEQRPDNSMVGRRHGIEVRSDQSGISISRRPNRRASTENAPGPRQTSALAMQAARAVSRFVWINCRLMVQQHGRSLKTMTMHAIRLPNGVK